MTTDTECKLFEIELRKQCFQKPTPEAYDLAWCMWQARASIAQQPSVPPKQVAWWKRYPDGRVSLVEAQTFIAEDALTLGWKPLVFAAAPHPPEQPSVPVGWKLVPVNPTDEMLKRAQWEEYGESSCHRGAVPLAEVADVWQEFLAAAPQPPQQPIDKAELKRQVSLVFGEEFAIVRQPPERVPLSDEQIKDNCPFEVFLDSDFAAGVCFAEHYHGIVAKEQP